MADHRRRSYGSGMPTTNASRAVILVDDSVEVRRRLRDLLNDSGAARVVGEAASAHEALELIDAHRPDTVVLDLALRDSSGLDVLRGLRERGLGCEVIVLTNSSSPVHRTLCLRLGAMHFLNKTTEFEQVIDVLSSELPSTPAFAASDLLESIDGIVWEADATTFRFSFVSRQAERILGYPVSAWLEDPDFWVNHLHPADRDTAVDDCAMATHRGENHALEYRIRAADGRDVWVRDIVTFVARANATPLLRGLMVDISAEKEVERRLQQSTRLYRLLSAVNQVVARHPDPGTLFERATEIAVKEGGFAMSWTALRDDAGNVRLQAIAGAPEGARASVEALLAAPPDIGCLQTLHALATGEVSVSNDIEHDPTTAHWRATALVLGFRAMAAVPFRQEGVVVGSWNLYASEPQAFDATEQRVLDDMAAAVSLALDAFAHERRRSEAEHALQESEERFRVLAETIHDVFWMTSADKQRMLYVSPAYERVWGRPSQRLYDRPAEWLEAVHPDDRDAVQDSLGRQRQGEYDIEYRIVRPDGDIRWIRDQAFPVATDGGEVQRVVGIAHDITDRKLAEARLRETERNESIGRIAAAVAHDFNNVLTVVNSVAELALADLPAESPLREDLNVIRNAGQQAAGLTRQLLAFGRRQPMAPERLNLNALITDSELLLRRALGSQVQLVTVLEPDLENVFVDRGQLQQVLMNLAMNSRDAMPDGGRITITTARVAASADPRLNGGDYVRLAIGDTGAGMDEATARRIFEPYFTTKAPAKGTGLGLATVQGIVKQSGGEIFVRSARAAGTEFTIYLPVYAATDTRNLADSR